MDIGYLSECASDYAKELLSCKTPDDYYSTVGKWKELVPDAFQALEKTNDPSGWQEFIKGLKLERKGKFAGEDWGLKFGAIVMPELLMRIEIIANQFKVPWGTAFIRCQEENFIKTIDGCYYWDEVQTTGRSVEDAIGR